VESKTNWRILFRLIPFTKPHRSWLLAAIVTGIVGGLVWIQNPLLIQGLTDAAVVGERERFLRLVYLTVAWVVARLVLLTLYQHASARAQIYPIRDLRDRLTAHIQRLPLSTVETHHTGDLVSRLNNDVDKVSQALDNVGDNAWQPIQMVLSIVYMALISWKLLLAGCILIPISTVLFNRVSKPMETLSRQRMQALGRINEVLQDTIGGIGIVKAFGAKQLRVDRFEAVARDVEHKGMGINRQNSLLLSLYLALRYIPQLVIPLYGGYLAFQGQISVGSVVAANVLVWQIFLPVERFLDFLRQMRETIPSVERLFELLDAEPERDAGQAFEMQAGAAPIEFEGVSFGYEQENRILDALSFEVPQGQTVALVGPSGSGKSTVFKLLCGFYSAQEGRVRVYGNDLGRCSPEDARAHVSFVAQESYLFPTTIGENIAYGRPESSRAEIIAAAKMANAHDFVREQPEGYDTQVGQRGTRLSGGQRQRIALARALLKDAPILLLDEPTSALDTQSEALVQEALDRLMEGRSTLVVAHRLSTIREADQVLVLDGGSIVESGTHEELIKGDTIYKKLYLRQSEAERAREGGAEEVFHG
jgi:subfamily B ATP-binding cassette protein MsbA/ATP-binding cassette subfamily B protein AbcA/BmrA